MTPSNSRNRSAPGSPFKDLAQRAASAAVFALIAITLTAAGPWPFTIMVAAGSVVLAREWGLLSRGSARDAAFYAHAVSVSASCVLAAMAMVWPAFAALGAGALAVMVSRRDDGARLWSALGVIYLGLAAVLLVILRGDAAYGLSAVLFLFLVVWSADTAAYFAGRLLGGPRLAPSVSPGKTWSGFVGGLAVPAFLAYGFALWLGDTPAMKLAIAGMALALASQIGDLAESAIKRKFGAKDSGQLLPGHGGLFDRVDGLIGATLAGGLFALVRDWFEPGRALLIWT